MASSAVCEWCGKEATKCCASVDQASMWFCDFHYRIHVDAEHGGKPLPGSLMPERPHAK